MEWISSYLPSGDRLMMQLGAALGAASSFLFGEWGDALGWLMTCVIVDFVLGTCAAARLGEWNSDTGSKGIIKKAFVFGIVSLCHGIDVSMPVHILSLKDMAVCAFILNESGSIIENIVKLGYGSVIPDIVLRALKALKNKQEHQIEQLEEKDGGREDRTEG